MKRFSWGAFVLLLGHLHANAAPVCISGNSLASYESLGAIGCDVGPVTVKDFVFNVASVGGGAIAVADTDITVTTEFIPGGVGLGFASGGFNVSGTGFANYLIAYTWDPTADIRGAADILDPGLADIVTDLCVGAAFSGATCAGAPISLHVFQGATSQLTDSVTFAATAILGIRNNISLNANGGTAGFERLNNQIFLPEPASLFYLGAGLAVLAVLGPIKKYGYFALQRRAEFGRASTRHPRR